MNIRKTQLIYIYRSYLVHLVFSISIFPIFRVFSIYRFSQIWVYWYLMPKVMGIAVSLYPPPWPGLTCNKLVVIVRLVTRLFQQGCYNHDITILLQPCVVNLITSCCIMTVSDLLEQLVVGLIMPLSLLQVVNNLSQTCYNKSRNKQCEHNLLTTCEQTCYNLFADS